MFGGCESARWYCTYLGTLRKPGCDSHRFDRRFSLFIPVMQTPDVSPLMGTIAQ